MLIGPELVLDQSDKSGGGAEHRFDVAVISDEAGFLTAKQIAGAVSQALVDAHLTLAGADLVSISFMPVSYTHLDVYKRQVFHQSPAPAPEGHWQEGEMRESS